MRTLDLQSWAFFLRPVKHYSTGMRARLAFSHALLQYEHVFSRSPLENSSSPLTFQWLSRTRGEHRIFSQRLHPDVCGRPKWLYCRGRSSRRSDQLQGAKEVRSIVPCQDLVRSIDLAVAVVVLRIIDGGRVREVMRIIACRNLVGRIDRREACRVGASIVSRRIAKVEDVIAAQRGIRVSLHGNLQPLASNCPRIIRTRIEFGLRLEIRPDQFHAG